MTKELDAFRITEPGIYDITPENYHKDPVDTPSLSSSIARTLVESSPLHGVIKHPRLAVEQQTKESDTFDIGRAAHTMLLGKGGGFAVHNSDTWRGNIDDMKSAAWKAKQRAEGLTPILAGQYHITEEMVQALREQVSFTEARGAFSLTKGVSEQCLVWIEETRNGPVWCRALLDYMPNGAENKSGSVLYDYKTTVNAHPDQWARSAFNYGYDFQAAFYLRGWRAITGKEARFRFIAQEKSSPFCICPIEFTPAALAMADRRVTKAIELWAECLAKQSWPPYPARVCYVDIPAWLEKQQTEREMTDPPDGQMVDELVKFHAPHDQ